MSLLENINQLLSQGEVVTSQKEKIPITVFSRNDNVDLSRRVDAKQNIDVVNLCEWYVAPADPSYGNKELLRTLWKGKGVAEFVDGLNLIIMGLLPEQPKSIAPFEVRSEKYLNHGRAEFSEVVGTRYMGEERLVMEDEYFREGFELLDRQIVFPQEQKQVWRNIVINFYPHVDIARLVAYSHGNINGWTKQAYEEARHIRLGWFNPIEIDWRKGVTIDSMREFLKERIKADKIMDMRSKHYYGSSI